MKFRLSFALLISLSFSEAFLVSTQTTGLCRGSAHELSVKGQFGRGGVEKLSAIATKRQRGAISKPSLVAACSNKNYGVSKKTSLLIEYCNEGTVDASKEAEKILYRLEEMEGALTAVHYASVINSWANAGNTTRALSVLNRMIRYQESDEISSKSVVLPNSHCYSIAMKAIINSFKTRDQRICSNGSLAEQCENLVDKMKKINEATDEIDARPNTVVFNTLLAAYSEDVTALFLKRKMDDRKRLYPNVEGLSNADDKALKNLVGKALDLLKEMEDKTSNFPDPDVYSYCTVISILAKCEDMEMALLAETYLPTVTNRYDTPTYNALISAYANTGTIKGAERANALLEELEAAMIEANSSVQPRNFGANAITYHSVLSGYIKTCKIGDDGYAAEKAESILNRMEEKLSSSKLTEEEKHYRYQPNVIAYSSIIDAWSKSGTKTDRAEALLHRMENKGIKPNVVTYTSVLTSFARNDSIEGPSKAMELLQHMSNLYIETGDTSVKPNVISYFAVIDCWCRCNVAKGGFEAEKLLQEMEKMYRHGDKKMRPDVRVYARIIFAHAKSGNFDHAINVLKRMEEFTLTGDEKYALAKPNQVCYNTLINAFGQRGKAKKALGVLNQMDQFSSKSGGVVADERTFNAIIHVLSTSNLKGKARKALKILERLENSHIDGDWTSSPSARSYNMIINACSNSIKADEQERKEALDIAFDVFFRMRSSLNVKTDRYTYISMLKTCGKLIPKASIEDRKLAVGTVFRACCDEGLVDQQILTNFLMASPDDLIQAMLGQGRRTSCLADLPKEWSDRSYK